MDPAIGVYIIDRYTFYALKFLENVKLKSRISMKSFVSYLKCTNQYFFMFITEQYPVVDHFFAFSPDYLLIGATL